MIRTTYRGRHIKVLAARGNPHQRKMVINGKTIHHGWQGDDIQALDWFKNVIDRLDTTGPGVPNIQPPYERHWWEPGTFDVNPNGHVTLPGSVCVCSQCVIDDPTGSKARYTPLAPDACQHCHQLEDGHDDDVFLDWHRYTAPTEQQRAGRQGAIDDYNDTGYDDPEPCPAVYPKDLPGYLSRPQCGFSIDHREAVVGDPTDHIDNRGFRWPHTATQGAA
jgi:hypothetical protein